MAPKRPPVAPRHRMPSPRPAALVPEWGVSPSDCDDCGDPLPEPNGRGVSQVTCSGCGQVWTVEIRVEVWRG